MMVSSCGYSGGDCGVTDIDSEVVLLDGCSCGTKLVSDNDW